MNDNVRVMRGIRIVSLLAIAALLACASPAAAVVDTFWAEVGAGGNVVIGGGSGYGTPFMTYWFYYENTDWWNQWFNNAPFDPDRWKEIDVSFYIYRLDPDAGDAWAEVTYNWSTPEWAEILSSPIMPPLPPLTVEQEDLFIERAEPPIFEGLVPDIMLLPVTDHYVIEDYNPQWVSIDIRGYNFGLDGFIDHRCVPEPATLGLMLLGGLALVRRRRKSAGWFQKVPGKNRQKGGWK